MLCIMTWTGMPSTDMRRKWYQSEAYDHSTIREGQTAILSHPICVYTPNNLVIKHKRNILFGSWKGMDGHPINRYGAKLVPIEHLNKTQHT